MKLASFIKVAAEIDSRFGGLIIANILGGNTQTIGDVEHETWESMCGGNRGGVDSKFSTLLIAHHHLLTPIAQNIG